MDRVVTLDGADTSDGSAEHPWRTLQHAANTVPVGGTVWLRSGSYVGFTMTRSGNPGMPIVFAGWPGDARPVVDGAFGARIDVVKFSAVHDVRIQGLTIRGAAGGSFSGSGLRVENGSARVEIRDDLITENQGFGVIADTSTEVLVVDNEISHNAAGVYLSHAGAGTIVRDNRIHHTDRMLRNTIIPTNDDAGGDAIVLHKTTGATLITGNLVWGNRALSYDYGWDGGAYSIYGASNTTIIGNVAWDNENVMETGTDSGLPCDNNRFLRNVSTGFPTAGRSLGMFLRCATNMLIAHNTFQGLLFGFSLGSDSPTYSGKTDGMRIVNNIVDLGSGKPYGVVTDLPATVVINYNLVHGTSVVATWPGGSTTSLAMFTAMTGYEQQGRWGDPAFVSAEDLHLTADSPAVDLGMVLPGVNDGWTGAGPDAGAYER